MYNIEQICKVPEIPFVSIKPYIVFLNFHFLFMNSSHSLIFQEYFFYYS